MRIANVLILCVLLTPLSTDSLDRHVQELPTQSESPVTSMAFDPDNPNLFIAGFGDGTAQLFDRRLDEDDALVRSFRGHSTWIQGVRWQTGSARDFVSAR